MLHRIANVIICVCMRARLCVRVCVCAVVCVCACVGLFGFQCLCLCVCMFDINGFIVASMALSDVGYCATTTMKLRP